MLSPAGSPRRMVAKPVEGTDQTSRATAAPPVFTRTIAGWRLLIDHRRYTGSVSDSRTNAAPAAIRFGLSSRPRISVPLTARRTWFNWFGPLGDPFVSRNFTGFP